MSANFRAARKGETVKKVLAILGSPRPGGNCEIMAKEISGNIRSRHDLQLLRLSEFSIRPCTGCYACLAKGRCVIA